MSMFTPPGTRAGRVRRGGRRRGLAVLLAVVMTTAAGAVAWYVATRPDAQVSSKPKVSCPAPQPTQPVVPPSRVKVHVYNATDRSGLAATTAEELRRRGFRIKTIGNDSSKRTVTGPAEVRHGAAGTDAARTVAAQVGDIASVPVKRGNASVDLVLGAAFRALLPATEAAAALARSQEPSSRPAGC